MGNVPVVTLQLTLSWVTLVISQLYLWLLGSGSSFLGNKILLDTINAMYQMNSLEIFNISGKPSARPQDTNVVLMTV